MHAKIEEAPNTLTSRNVASIEVLFDFIIASPKLHCNVIMAFVHIFVDILDSFDRGNGLDIDMVMVLPDKIGRVCDDPMIVDLLSPNVMCVSSVPAPGQSISILRNGGLIPERLWKVFGAVSILHARCIRVLSPTGIVNHELFYQLEQLRIVLWKL